MPGTQRRRRRKRPFTFVLDGPLVEQVREEVGEPELVRSIEAALAAALDYSMWVREVENGERSPLE